MSEEFQKTNPLARGDKTIKPLEVYAEHTEIRKQVYEEIKKLYATFSSAPSTFLTIDRFLGCITPIKNLHDPGRLPICTDVPRSTGRGKLSCVWAVVSCLVQTYWAYELGDWSDDKFTILTYLDKLKEINEHYPKLKIAGAEDKGYWLEL